MAQRGAVAAGHPLTAEAGAAVLREGGNAVDAAVAAVLASFVTESPLTGLGAGGFMLVHDAATRPCCSTSSSPLPGADGVERRSELVPIPVHFTEESAQVFNVGAASCGVPGTPAGLERGAGAVRLDAAGGAGRPRPSRLAREGVVVNAEQAYFIEILEPILTHYAEAAGDLRAGGRAARRGRPVPLRGARRRARAARGRGRGALLPRRDRASGSPSGCVERGGTLGVDDLAAYEPIEREPVGARSAAARCSPTRRRPRAGS